MAYKERRTPTYCNIRRIKKQNVRWTYFLHSRYLLLHYVRGRSHITVGRKYLIFPLKFLQNNSKGNCRENLAKMKTLLLLCTLKQFSFVPKNVFILSRNRRFCWQNVARVVPFREVSVLATNLCFQRLYFPLSFYRVFETVLIFDPQI